MHVPLTDDRSAARHALPPLPEPDPAPSRMIAVRVLLMVGLLVGVIQSVMEPVDRPLHELFAGLERGDVETVTIVRPAQGAGASGGFPVEWTGDGRPGRASYQLDTLDGSTAFDQGEEILEAAGRSPEAVEVTIRDHVPETGVTWHLLGLAGVAALLLLVVGPRPRLATAWAWFWLAMSAPVVWLAFVVLEPMPFWRREPLNPHRRLTGGWAFLISITVVPYLASTLTAASTWVL
ncbi:hypothetical protein [Georgenia deserti]|uniref:DUF3592 domain-containing protein n=1 Tax=Georgenia deserti TaxID=2093781 RepID=A0ABW4L3W2_9MICO